MGGSDDVRPWAGKHEPQMANGSGSDAQRYRRSIGLGVGRVNEHVVGVYRAWATGEQVVKRYFGAREGPAGPGRACGDRRFAGTDGQSEAGGRESRVWMRAVSGESEHRAPVTVSGPPQSGVLEVVGDGLGG